MIGQAANDDFKDGDQFVAAPSQHLPSPSTMDYFHRLHQHHQRRRITKRRTFQDLLLHL